MVTERKLPLVSRCARAEVRQSGPEGDLGDGADGTLVARMSNSQVLDRSGNTGGAPTLPLPCSRRRWCGALDTTLSRGSSAGSHAMTSFAPRRAGLFALLGALLIGAPAPVAAQYFGRNKVQYEKFDWRIMRTSHFDLYFYPAESLVVHDAGPAGRALVRAALGQLPAHVRPQVAGLLRRSPGLPADERHRRAARRRARAASPKELRTRVIMPFTGIYADNDHVLGHELVHVFQYNIAEGDAGRWTRCGSTRCRSGSSKAWPSTSRSAATIRSPRCGCATR